MLPRRFRPSRLQPMSASCRCRFVHAAGVEVLSDIGDRDKGHTSRTVVSKGTLTASRWSDQRADLLVRDGFTIETP